MSKPIDYDAMARSFLDLWQDQASKMARDPEWRGLAEQWMALFMPFAHGPVYPDPEPGRETDGLAPDYRAGGVGRARKADGGVGDGSVDDRTDDSRSRQAGAKRAGTDGSEAAAPLSDDRDAELERLAARVRELEERIAGLESRPRERSAGAGTTSERQRRSDGRKRRV